jgi:hypothetical protein
MYSGGVALDSRWRKAARVDSDPPRRAGHALGLEIARHRPDARSRPKTRGDDPGGSGRARRGFALRARLAFPGAFRAARAAPRHRFLSSSALDGPSSAFARKAKIPVHVVPAPGKPRPKVPDILGWRRALEAWGDQAKPAKLDPRRHRHRTVSTANAISAQMFMAAFHFGHSPRDASRCHAKSASGRCHSDSQAATARSRHVLIAAARSLLGFVEVWQNPLAEGRLAKICRRGSAARLAL